MASFEDPHIVIDPNNLPNPKVQHSGDGEPVSIGRSGTEESIVARLVDQQILSGTPNIRVVIAPLKAPPGAHSIEFLKLDTDDVPAGKLTTWGDTLRLLYTKALGHYLSLDPEVLSGRVDGAIYLRYGSDSYALKVEGTMQEHILRLAKRDSLTA